MSDYFSDNAWWLFHSSIDSLIVLFFSIMVVVMVFIYAEDHKDIHSDRFYLYIWSSFTIFSVLMLALSIFICNAGYGSVDDQLLQGMDHQEKQIAKSMIEKSHHPINFFQWNEIIEKNEAIIQKKETIIENKKKMLDPKVIKELELLRN